MGIETMESRVGFGGDDPGVSKSKFAIQVAGGLVKTKMKRTIMKRTITTKRERKEK